MTQTTLMLAALCGLALGCQWLAWRLRTPAILLLLLAGALLGPVTGLLDPDRLLGGLLFPVVSIGVAIILFEGALTLRFEEIQGLLRVVGKLVSIGLLVSFAVLTLAAHYLIPLSMEVAAVFGAVMVVTGPTVITPLLRSVRPTKTIEGILRWEGIIIDPMGAIFAVLVFDFILVARSGEALLQGLTNLGITIAIGAGCGWLAGWLSAQTLRRDLLPLYLRKFGMLAVVLLAYTLSNRLHAESGLLTVTVMGLYLANAADLDIEDIVTFKEDLTVILLSGIFILLAARMDLSALAQLGPQLLLLLAAVLFVARPLGVLLCTLRSPLNWRERTFLAWIAPRGIVAAAVGSLFSLQLAAAGVPDADQLMPLCFAVIFTTVILQSLTARPLAGVLGVRRPAAAGVLLIGANALARAIGTALKSLEIPVILTDTSWDNCRLARMEGLEAYYGNAQSEHAETVLDLSSIRYALALTPNHHANTAATLHFADLFGDRRVFALPAPHLKRNQVSRRVQERQILFGNDAAFGTLATLLAQGASIRKTTLSENFGWTDYCHKNPQAWPLFLIDRQHRLTPVTGAVDNQPAGTTVIALTPPEAEPARAAG